MSYLLDQVNSELADRIAVLGSPPKYLLQIDFENSTLKLPGNHLHRCCPLDGDNIIEAFSEKDHTLDAVVINIPLAWLDLEVLLPLVKSSLSEGGRFFFATFGPDTLIELRQAWAKIDSSPHVHPFIDLHHIGDLLVKTGFNKPIVDADWLGVEYQDIDLLLQDLRSEGFHNVSSNRRKTLTGKTRLESFKQLFSRSNEPVQMTFEILYGYAEVSPSTSKTIQVSVPTLG